MTLHQAEAFLIVAGMLVLFVSERLRYDVVAALALSAAALTGIVPPQKVFQGFANPVIIIIASVLVLGRAIAVSGILETSMRRLIGRLKTTSLQVGALTACVTFLSAIMKNVGTLGIFMPIAIQSARQSERSVSLYLMPMAFGSLVGGTITQIGTSPNLLISAVRQETQGRPFTLFDFTPVGLPLSIAAIAFLAFGWRLIPRGRIGQAPPDRKFEIDEYISEVRLPPSSPLVNKTVHDLESLGEGDVTVTAIVRDSDHHYIPAGHWVLFTGDLLILEADPIALKPFLQLAGLETVGGHLAASHRKSDQLDVAEAIILADSPLVGQTVHSLHLRQRYEVNLLAVGRNGQRITTRLRNTDFRVGDTVVLQGRESTLPDIVTKLGCLPLAERNLAIGRRRSPFLAAIILGAALIAIAGGWLHAEIGFFVAAMLVILFKTLTPKEAYDAIDWPIIVMLGCLIPVGEALKETGATDLIAAALSSIAVHLPGELAVALLLGVAMLVTPFMHHAAAVLVMGPVAASIAGNLHFSPDAFLMAVALGASCDFLTPIGHQNNLLVMGPGGYRFSDYWRLGLPLSILVLVFGTWLILRAWPLHAS